MQEQFLDFINEACGENEDLKGKIVTGFAMCEAGNGIGSKLMNSIISALVGGAITFGALSASGKFDEPTLEYIKEKVVEMQSDPLFDLKHELNSLDIDIQGIMNNEMIDVQHKIDIIPLVIKAYNTVTDDKSKAVIYDLFKPLELSRDSEGNYHGPNGSKF